MPIINSVTAGRGTKPPQLYETEVVPTSFPTIVEPPEEADGWSKVTVLAPDNLEAGNIRKGVTIAGVEGIYEQIPNLQKDKHVKPEAFPLDVQADAGYAGLENAVIETPDNLEAENIKNGVTIAGVEGTYTGAGDAKFTAYLNGTITEVTASDWGDATSVDGYTLYNRWMLKKVVMSDRIASVSEMFCSHCSALEMVHVSASLTTVGFGFLSYTNIESIELPETLETIGNNFLLACFQLSSAVTIPAKVTSIGANFLSVDNKIPELVMKPTTPPTLGYNAFYNTSSSLVITVPKGSLDAYKTATNWSTYADRMQEAEE